MRGKGADLRRTPAADGEIEAFHLKPAAALGDDSAACAAEPVDRLGFVADGEDDGPKRPEQIELHAIRVLKFVCEDVRIPTL